MKNTWLLTGSSKGFGRIWAEATLKRSDLVVATTRQLKRLQTLSEIYGDSVLTLSLGDTERTTVEQLVKQAHEHSGHLDVIANNAGYGQLCAIE